MEYNIKYIPYSGYTPKYIKYIGFGTHPNHFLYIFMDFGHFREKYKNIGKHFLKKSLPYETWGQTPMLKRMVYGSSSYEVFSKILQKHRNLLSILHFFWGPPYLI